MKRTACIIGFVALLAAGVLADTTQLQCTSGALAAVAFFAFLSTLFD
jgi:hypothetical protein